MVRITHASRTLLVVCAAGCGSPAELTTSAEATSQMSAPQAAAPGKPAVDDPDTSFGIPNTFSGKLSREQEGNVPEALRNAFYVESTRDISPAQLAEELKTKTRLVEETRKGDTYVALRDFRHVDFGEGTSGHMIVIERYRLKPP